MIILLSAVNEGIGAAFVGAFEDNKVAQILELPKHVKPVLYVQDIQRKRLRNYPESI